MGGGGTYFAPFEDFFWVRPNDGRVLYRNRSASVTPRRDGVDHENIVCALFLEVGGREIDIWSGVAALLASCFIELIPLGSGCSCRLCACGSWDQIAEQLLLVHGRPRLPLVILL